MSSSSSNPSRAVAEKAARGLTPGRRRVLEWMADHPFTTALDCASDLGITKAGVHYHRVSLAALGLIETRGLDARSARLTPSGFAALGRPSVCPTCARPLTTRSL